MAPALGATEAANGGWAEPRRLTRRQLNYDADFGFVSITTIHENERHAKQVLSRLSKLLKGIAHVVSIRPRVIACLLRPCGISAKSKQATTSAGL